MVDGKQDTVRDRILKLFGWLSIPGWVATLWKYLWKIVGWLGNYDTVKDHFLATVCLSMVVIAVLTWVLGGIGPPQKAGNAAAVADSQPAPVRDLPQITPSISEKRKPKKSRTKLGKQTDTATLTAVPIKPAPFKCRDGRIVPTAKDCGLVDLEMRDNYFGPGAMPDLSNVHRGIVSGNIVDSPPQNTPDTRGSASSLTGMDNIVRGTSGDQQSALFDVKQLDDGCFDNNTVVGNTEILKAEKAKSVVGTNNVGYRDPNARPIIRGNDRRYNYNDWLDFLEGVDGTVVDGKLTTDSVAQLRTRLESEWSSLDVTEREKRRHELDSLEEKLKSATRQTYWSITEPLRHAENVARFVRMPCH